MHIKKEEGQTTVEYVLLIAMSVAIVYSVGMRIKDYVLTEDCEANPSNTLCIAQKLLNPEDNVGLRYFSLLRTGPN